MLTLHSLLLEFTIIDLLKDLISSKWVNVFAGEHPRTGAMDVCPFIPVQNVTMEDCVTCANLFAERLADALHIPGGFLLSHG